MAWKQIALQGWGRVTRSDCLAARPERAAEVPGDLAADSANGILAQGAARSYGDAALNSDGRIILTTRLDRILAFDGETGDITCEPGVTFAELLRIFLPRGFLVPVSPGTSFVTLGGAVANDVHGKNHDRVGSFGDHLHWLDLLLPDGQTRRVSPTEDPALFRATIGGIGLTGIILAVAFRMRRVPSNAMLVSEQRMPDLERFMAALGAARQNAAYSVGWIDALATGGALGRGVLETAEPADLGVTAPPAHQRRVPIDLPGVALSSLSVRAFNEAYYRRIPEAGRSGRVAISRFLYPLDALSDWNRIYGKRGFRQFQCVIPDAFAAAGIQALLQAISAARGASFLAVLKTLGSTGSGPLSFALPGFTLALDFPERPGLSDLMQRLHRLTLDHGGRIYLAKDSCLDAASFAAMYPRLDEFRAVLDTVDPNHRLASDMSRRLRIRA